MSAGKNHWSGGRLKIFNIAKLPPRSLRSPSFMSPELQRALNRHTQWFGSYKASGQLKKLLV